MKKRVFSLLLALALLCSLLPQIAPPVHADTPYSGSCGRNLTWTFDPDTGTLSFQGSGDMEDYDFETAPWYPYHDVITTATFPVGLTTIGDSAFFSCYSLKEVALPAGLTEISGYAFYDCYGLTAVILPESLTFIGRNAFTGTGSLDDIYFGGSYEQWTALNISEVADRIHCNTTDPTSHWTVEEQAPTCTEDGYRSKSCSCGYETGEGIPPLGHNYVDGVCTRCGMKDSDNDVSGVCGEKLTWTYDPDRGKLTIEGSGAMDDYDGNGYWRSDAPWFDYSYYIHSVSLPAGLTSIGDYAFSWCNVSDINLPEGLTAIGAHAFDSCNFTELTLPSSLKKIGSYAFRRCPLTEIVIPEGIAAIPAYAFEENFNLTTVFLPATVTSIGEDAFFDCEHLTSIVVPSSVVSLDIYSQALGYLHG